MISPLFILHHLLAIALIWLAALGGLLFGWTAGRGIHVPRARRTIELGYIAEIPVAYLTDPADAVYVSKWLAEMRDGVSVRV